MKHRQVPRYIVEIEETYQAERDHPNPIVNPKWVATALKQSPSAQNWMFAVDLEPVLQHRRQVADWVLCISRNGNDMQRYELKGELQSRFGVQFDL